MKLRIEISERPATDIFWGPHREPSESRARLADLESVLGVLAPRVQPLAVEVGLSRRDARGFLEPFDRVFILREKELPSGVVASPTVAGEVATQYVERVTPAALKSRILEEFGYEWARVVFLAVAARLSRTPEALTVVDAPEAELFRRDGALSVCGPYDHPGLRIRPPIAVEINDLYGSTQLTVQAYASAWQRTDSPEFAAHERLLAALQRAGWTREVPE